MAASIETDPGDDVTDDEHGRFGAFLVCLVAILIVSGVHAVWAEVVVVAISALLTLLALRVARLSRNRALLAGLGAAALIAAPALAISRSTSAWSAVPMFVQAGVLAVLVVMTLRAALARTVVDEQALLAAISAYVLIGFTYTWLYLAIDTVSESQLSMPATDAREFYEYSFVVQTTVGFGNQLPDAAFAARVTITQAIVGQLFLAVLVARLVANYGATNARPRRRRGT